MLPRFNFQCPVVDRQLSSLSREWVVGGRNRLREVLNKLIPKIPAHIPCVLSIQPLYHSIIALDHSRTYHG